jgi:hypothetical protein
MIGRSRGRVRGEKRWPQTSRGACAVIGFASAILLDVLEGVLLPWRQA